MQRNETKLNLTFLTTTTAAGAGAAGRLLLLFPVDADATLEDFPLFTENNAAIKHKKHNRKKKNIETKEET